MRFTATTSDAGVYVFGPDEHLSILTMYVYSLLLYGGDTPLLKHAKSQLMDRFAMAGMGVDGGWHENHEGQGG